MNIRVCSFPVAIEQARDFLDSQRKDGRVPNAYAPGNAGASRLLFDTFFNKGKDLTGGKKVHLSQTLPLGDIDGWKRAASQNIIPVTPFIGPGVRKLVNAGHAKFVS